MPHTYIGGSRRNSIPCGSPIPSYSRAGSNGAYSYRKNSSYPYNRRYAFPLLCGSADRGAVTGKSQMILVDQPIADRKVQELLFIEPENKEERINRL